MSPKRSLVYGPQALVAAESLRQQQTKDKKWPYSWIEAPPGSKQDQGFGYLAIPAAGVVSEVMAYTVADGLSFYPTHVVFQVLGANWTAGDFLWTMDVNSPVGVSAPQSLPIDGYAAVPFPLGTLEIAWEIPRAERNLLHSRDVLRIKATNVGLGVGAGQFLGLVKGYLLASVE